MTAIPIHKYFRTSNLDRSTVINMRGLWF
jgi:hypothetical protein